MMAEGACDEAEPRFRVSVCLKRFFRDERALCFVSVPPRRRVRWLLRRLRELFPLPPRLALLLRGHLLPRDEPLALLERDERVEVVPRGSGGAASSDDVIDGPHLELCLEPRIEPTAPPPPPPDPRHSQPSPSRCGDSSDLPLCAAAVQSGRSPRGLATPTEGVAPPCGLAADKEGDMSAAAAELLECKRRALRLLERRAGPRARRRVRRRRPQCRGGRHPGHEDWGPVDEKRGPVDEGQGQGDEERGPVDEKRGPGDEERGAGDEERGPGDEERGPGSWKRPRRSESPPVRRGGGAGGAARLVRPLATPSAPLAIDMT